MNSGDLNAKVVLYSHDTMGLGHIRRNLLIAQAFMSSDIKLNVLLIAGAAEANSFLMPAGVDLLTLPALHKVANGDYETRSLQMSLESIIDLRRRTIDAAIEAFDPDVMVVDKVPRGVEGELDITLERLRRRGKARCVLGLRDILDDPQTVRAEWKHSRYEESIADNFDEIWVYGDSSVYDVADAYAFSPETTAKIRYTGYFDKRKRLEWNEDEFAEASLFDHCLENGRRLVLCALGGGEDGGDLAEAFARTEFPEDYCGLIVSGPFMPSETYQALQDLAAANSRLTVIRLHKEPTQLLQNADRVIAMGGYNTVSEAISFGKRTLIVPRVKPRKEQLIRAMRFHELGLVDYLHPDEASPQKFAEWLAVDQKPVASVAELIDMNGLDRLPRLLHRLLMGGTPPLDVFEPGPGGFVAGKYVS